MIVFGIQIMINDMAVHMHVVMISRDMRIVGMRQMRVQRQTLCTEQGHDQCETKEDSIHNGTLQSWR